ncbi:gas vesicle protein [Alkalicoccus chagannorensis]|uniref:gas vesicle protein n=1 Tax=Alkalicoccus chagannorensis TaxID=427072 RepID=UPI000409FBDC|nr:gas vesicle protein [Alkalicoccus chagannorensis]
MALDRDKEVALVDVLDAVLQKGVVVKGDIMLSIADIDLVYIDLRLLISAVDTLQKPAEKGVEEVE